MGKHEIELNIDDLKRQKLIVFECLSGSHAYGLATEKSDIDIKGVFVLPKTMYFGLNYVPQISDKTNDQVYYEIGRFMELLSESNPNVLEMLHTRTSEIRFCHPAFETIRKTPFLSKKCRNTFGSFAEGQIRKAKGLNKKIFNPMDKERRTCLDFCHVITGNGSVKLSKYMTNNNLEQQSCGLSRINNTPDLYAFYSNSFGLRGIIKNANANDIMLSNVPKDLKPDAIMHFNKSAYSMYCKNYMEYWDWVEKRNESRFSNQLVNELNYDSKNMMHVFRLLKMCLEIAMDNMLNIWRPDRDELLRIKNGHYSYDELIIKAEKILERIDVAYTNCHLPENLDVSKVNRLLVEFRIRWY